MSLAREGVLILVGGYPPAYLGGGPIRTIEAMVETRRTDVPVRVLTSARDHGCTELLDVPVDSWTQQGRALVLYADMAGIAGKFRYLRELRRDRSDTLYVNSLFATWISVLPLILQRIGLLRFPRVVLAPRGELDPGALELKSAKKSVFLKVTRLLQLHRGVTWHASSDLERDNIRAFFPEAQVVVKENETLVRARPEADETVRTGPVRFAYLGRVSEKKRVHLLIEAVAGLPPESYELTIHGGGDDEYVQECKELASRLGVPAHFGGPVEHADVADCFDAADFACFPTSGENFGHVIAEAMARGCPVVIGDVTPWTERVRDGRGQIIEDSGDSTQWSRCLSDLAALKAADPEELVRRRRQTLRTYRGWLDARARTSFLDDLPKHY